MAAFADGRCAGGLAEGRFAEGRWRGWGVSDEVSLPSASEAIAAQASLERSPPVGREPAY